MIEWLDSAAKTGWFSLIVVSLFTLLIVLAFRLGYETGKGDARLDAKRAAQQAKPRPTASSNVRPFPSRVSNDNTTTDEEGRPSAR